MTLMGSLIGVGSNDMLSLKELALLAGATVKALRHELEDDVLRPRKRRGSALLFGQSELLFVVLVTRLKERLGLDAEDRKALFELVVHERARSGDWRRLGRELVHTRIPISVRVHVVDRETRDAFRRHVAQRRRVISDPEILAGEPIFKGTRIPVMHVGEMLRRNVSAADLLSDFPSLSEGDLEFARRYVELGPPPGRPQRRLQLRRGVGLH